MRNILTLEEIEQEKYKLLDVEKRHFEIRRKDWPFISNIEKERTNLRLAYVETRESIISYVISNNLNKEQYIEIIEYSLSFLYDLNNYMQNALGINTENNYVGLWESVDFNVANVKNITSKYSSLPKNLESFVPVVDSYIKYEAIHSNHIDQVLINFMAFTQLNSFVSTMAFYGLFNRETFIGKLLNKKRSHAKEGLVNQLNALNLIYIQCANHMFNPTVIHELAIDIRKKVDFYEGIFFNLLDAQISRRKRQSGITTCS